MSHSQDNHLNKEQQEINEDAKRLVNDIFEDLKKHEQIKLSNGNKHFFCIDYVFDDFQDLNDISFDNDFNSFCNNLLEVFQSNNYAIEDFQIDYLEERGFFKKYRIAKIRLIYV